MLKALFDRLKLVQQKDGIDIKTYPERIQERQQLRDELAQARAEREAEIADIEQASNDLDYADAMDSDTSSDNSDSGEEAC